MAELITINSSVGRSDIRTEQHNGRDHLVVSSMTLPFDVVMNGGLYPASEIQAHYEELEGTLAPLGHPVLEGEFISAYSAEALNTNYCGAWNRNVKLAGNRVSVEKWIDIEVAERTDQGRELVRRVRALESGESDEPISTSVGLYLERVETNASDEYQWIAKIDRIDHDAILLDEKPAADPSQGVGMVVNVAEAVPVSVPRGVLKSIGYNERARMIAKALPEDAWPADFTEDQVIVASRDSFRLYDYTVQDGSVVLSDTGTDVQRQESWYSVNRLLKLFKRPIQPNEEKADMALTPEEKSELLDGMKAIVEPINERMAGIEANQKRLTDRLDSELAANEQTMREAVAAEFGEEVAKELTGNALKLMADKCGKGGVKPLATNRADSDPLTKFDEVPE